MALKQHVATWFHPPPQKKTQVRCTASSHHRGHQQAGCISVRLKRWLSTELPSKAAAPSSAWSGRLCPFLQPESSLAAARLRAGRGQSRHFRGHCQISASIRGCGSAPYNHPDVFNQLGFSSDIFVRDNEKKLLLNGMFFCKFACES